MNMRAIKILSALILTSLLTATMGVQIVYAAGIVVDTNADNTTTDGSCSLREAITNANNNAVTYSDCTAGSGADVISFNANYTITLAGNQLPVITSTITINGNGAASTIIQANANNPVTNLPAVATHQNRVFEVANGATLVLYGLTVRHGRCTGGCASGEGYGSGVVNRGTLTVVNSTFSGNGILNSGGGIFNDGGTLTVTNSIFSGNSASYGGGIYNNGGSLTTTDSTFSGNVNASNGGGIYNGSGSTATLTNNAFSGNTAEQGGGIYNNSTATITVTNSNFSGNSAGSDGGGIYNNGGTLILANDTFSGNSAFFWGGGIVNNASSTATVTNSTFSSNSSQAGGVGGGGIANFAMLTVTNSTFFNNSGYLGGGIESIDGTLTVANSTFSGNNAVDGGGIYNIYSTVIVKNSTFSGNGANNGAVINNNEGTLTLANTIIANRTSGGDCIGTSTAQSINNLIEDTTNACGLTGGVNGNITGSDPNLGLLANNGGTTQTFALLIGSPAIDSGDATTCSNAPVSGKDQRGVIRPQGIACDIGAYEFNGNAPQVVITPTTYNVNEQISLTLHGTGISVNDVNNDPLTVTVTATDANSRIFADTGSTNLVISSGNGTNNLVLTGTIAQLNEFFAGNNGSTLTYRLDDDTPVASVTLTITADDGSSTGSDSATVNITAVNDAPLNTVPGVQTMNEDTTLVFSTGNGNKISINDVDVGSDGLEITLSVTNGTLTLSGMTGLDFTTGDGTADSTMTFSGTLTDINNALATLTFNPTANYYGSVVVALTTSDFGNTGVGGAKTDSDNMNITVANVNDAPFVGISIPDQNATEDSAFIFQFAANTFGDPDTGDTLTYSAQLAGGGTIPAWSSFNAATRTFSGTPTNSDIGTLSVDVLASDGNGGNVTDTFDIAIANVNDSPGVSIVLTDYNTAEQTTLNLHATGISVTDNDTNTLTITVAGPAPLSGITANAGTTGVNIVSGNGTPSLVIGGTLAQINDFFGGNNGATLTYRWTGDTPAATATLTITADDGALSGNDTATINIMAVNDSPVNTVPAAQVATEDTALVFGAGNGNQIQVTDADMGSGNLEITLLVDNGTLTLASTSGLSFTTGDGTVDSTLVFTGTLADINNALSILTFNPTANYNGNAVMSIASSDLGNTGTGGTLTDTDVVSITIDAVNDSPTVANIISNQNATQGATFNFQFAANTFSDIDAGDILTYSTQLAGGGALPAWLSFDAVTRTFSGTPANGDIGTVSIDVIADDGNGGTVRDTFDIVVTNANDAPTVANPIPDQNATEDFAFNFQFAANTFVDPDIDTLTYSIQLAGGGALPAWLSFDAVTRTFSGTPSNADVGIISIDVIADDGNGGTVTETFNITVTAATYFSLGNRVWFDTNNNSQMDAGESGVDGVTVDLYAAGDLNTTLATQVTANGGYYLFNNLIAGEYVVSVAASNFGGVLNGYWSSATSRTAAGAITETYAQADPDNGPALDSDDNGTLMTGGALNGAVASSVVILGGAGTTEPSGETDLDATLPGNQQGQPDTQANMTIDFGFYTIALGDLVWNDLDNNGLFNGAEIGLDSVTVQLLSGDESALLATTTTSGGGIYTFDGLPAGTYVVRLSAINFNPGGILRDYRSSTGPLPTLAYEPAPDADSNLTNSDDNGTETNGLLGLGGYIQTLPATLIPAGEESVNNSNGSTTETRVDFAVNNTPQIDLVVTKTDDQSSYTAGGTLNYVIVITNNGPADANGMTVSDTRPAQITSWSWTCAAGTPAAYNCTNDASNPATFTDTLDLPQLGVVTYNVTAQVAPTAAGNISNLVFVSPPPALTDMAPLDNSATDTDVNGDVLSPSVTSTNLLSNYTTVGPTSFTVTFSEDINNPIGNTNTDDVTNPANYLLVEDGVNGVFDTTSCAGGLTTDDTQISVTNVAYNDATQTSTVSLGAALLVGHYRLFVCGTTSIVDIALNPLNGGVDFTFDFTVTTSASSLPATGFAPNRVTSLPNQPTDLAYASIGDIWLEIPSINIKSRLVGVPKVNNNWDVTWLNNDAGWLNGTAFPTWEGNSVVTAHVTDANGKLGPFANLKELKFGDKIIVHMYGEQYIFLIQATRTVKPFSTQYAFKHLEDHSYLTLITCQGYDPSSDSYLFRHVVRAVLVDVQDE